MTLAQGAEACARVAEGPRFNPCSVYNVNCRGALVLTGCLAEGRDLNGKRGQEKAQSPPNPSHRTTPPSPTGSLLPRESLLKSPGPLPLEICSAAHTKFALRTAGPRGAEAGLGTKELAVGRRVLPTGHVYSRAMLLPHPPVLLDTRGVAGGCPRSLARILPGWG